MKNVFCFLFSLVLLNVSSTAQKPVSANAEAFFQKAMAHINPKHVAWVKQTALDVNKKNLDENTINTLAKNYGQTAGISNGNDIMALVFLVMMQASKSAEDDLKSIMDQVKAINKQKDALRKIQESFNKMEGQNINNTTLDSFKLLTKNNNIKTATMLQPIKTQTNQNLRKPVVINQQKASSAEIKQVKDEIKGNLDSMNEMSETTSLRLQMTMDRQSKLMQAVSNIVKKINSTQDALISNMK